MKVVYMHNIYRLRGWWIFRWVENDTLVSDYRWFPTVPEGWTLGRYLGAMQSGGL